jgi:hypothetical protein
MIKDKNISDFLISEFENAWRQVMNIDNRRATFLHFYFLVFLGVLALIGSLWSKHNAFTPTNLILASAGLVLLIFVGETIMRVLISERDANVRYRNKINLIRGIFLSDVTDKEIKAYLSRKDLGIKTSADEASIEKTGGTLTIIFRMLRILRWVLVAGIVLLWLSSFWFYFFNSYHGRF